MTKLMWVMGLPLRLALIGICRAYRAVGGGALGGRCRFYPSCSHYAEQAVRVHGAAKGAALGAWRILRCNPFSRGGVEHVPPRGRALRYAAEYDAVVRTPGEVS